jgi:phosphatidylglycerophosphate synthase
MSGDTMRNRRPLATRGTRAAQTLARALGRTGVTPDAISLAGIGFALVAGAALAAAPLWPAGWIVAAAFIQLRLLANLMDGMVAVEGGRGGPLGPLYHEVPDRIEDTVILVGFGLGAGAAALGLWSALAALFCAYLRLLGGALGQDQRFTGPMAKQHRMAALTAGCLVAFGAGLAGIGPLPAQAMLALVLAGTILTALRRLAAIAADLRRGNG